VPLLFLALDAALYPTLLAAVVILLAQAHPRRLLAAYLAGGLLISITLGLVIVFALKDSHIVENQQSGPSWAADLAVGGLALLAAVAISVRADQRWRERRKRRKQAAGKYKPPDPSHEPWTQRILARGSVPIVFVSALAINLPGAAYLIALKDIAAGGYSSAEQVLLIIGFNLIMFSLAEIPLIGLLVAPDRTDAMVKRMNAWLTGHGRVIAIVLCVLLGAFLVTRGIINS
jgi:Sap, sulfolipid-1-addressing protein